MALLEKALPVDDREEFIKLLLYGPPGVGKTTFCSDAPNPIWFDFERSTETLRHIGKGYIPTLTIDELGTMAGFLQAVKELEKGKYQTAIIDTLSSLQDIQLAEHMAKTKGAENEARHLALFQDFRISTNVFKEICRVLQKMPINVVIIAHEKHMVRKNADGSETYIGVRPQMTPELNDAVTRLINVCAYYKKETTLRGEAKRKLYLNADGKIIAKNRLGIQEMFLENPTWADLEKGNNAA